MQLLVSVCVCGGREEVVVGSGVVLQSGTLKNAGREGQSRWELLRCCVGDRQQTPLHTHRTSPLLTLSLVVSRHKSVGAILRDRNEAGTDNLV